MKLAENGGAVAEGVPPDKPARRARGSADAAGTTRPAVIDARGLQKKFGSRVVLRDLSLRVHVGEIFGLIGPSGSGKTTMIHLLCGHLRPNGGTVTVLGEQPTAFTVATRRQIGYMPQNFILYPDLTVKQNVGFAAGLYGLGEWRSRRKIRATLELVELWDARKRTVRQTSGGMQRRLALAAALVHDPDLLFADEPTANLDPILRAKLWAHFRAMSAAGRTLLLTTQYIDEAEHCDRVGLVFDGALIAAGHPEMLRQRAFGGDIVEMVLDRPATPCVEATNAVEGVRKTDVVGADTLRGTVEDAKCGIPVLIDAVEAAGNAVRSVGSSCDPETLSYGELRSFKSGLVTGLVPSSPSRSMMCSHWARSGRKHKMSSSRSTSLLKSPCVRSHLPLMPPSRR